MVKFVVGLVISCASLSIVLGGESDEAASLMRAVCVNAEALRQYDVLIEIEEINDIPNDSVVRTVSFVRIRSDLDSGRVLTALFRRQVAEQLSNSNRSGAARRLRLCGFNWNGQEGVRLELPERPEPVSKYPLTHLLSQNVPDLKCVGLEFFPSVHVDTGKISSFQTWKNTQLLPPMLCVEARQNDNLEVVLLAPVGSLKGHQVRQTWHLDAQKLVPRRLERAHVISNDSTVQTTPMEMQIIDWEERSGVYVPTRIVGDRLALKDTTRYTHETTAYFHWLKVNEAMPKEDFESHWVASEDALIRLTDPSTNGLQAKTAR